MTYEIKNYAEEYLPKQVEIGSVTYESWNSGAQSGVEQLKRSYSKENFDSETKFYALKNREVVGFLTSVIQPEKEGEQMSARLEFPFVKSGEEAAKDELFQAAVAKLKDKGVKKLISRAGPGWVGTEAYAKMQGYTRQALISRAATINPNEVNYSVFPSSENVRDFNWDTDNEALAQAFVQAFKLDSVDEIKGLMSSIQTLSEDYKFISHKILWDGDKIIGRLLVYSKGDAPVGWLGSIVALGDRIEIERTLMGTGLKAAKDAGINKVHLALWNKAMEKEANYSYLKVDFYDSVSYWEKAI